MNIHRQKIERKRKDIKIMPETMGSVEDILKMALGGNNG
jgi:hypothetical protein